MSCKGSGNGVDIAACQGTRIRLVRIQGSDFPGRDHLHALVTDDMIEIGFKGPEGLLLLGRRFHRRLLPLGSGRIRSPGKIDPIPKLPVHEFTRMIVDADDTAPLTGQFLTDAVELRARLLDGFVRPAGAHNGLTQFQDRQHAAIPKRTVVQVDVGRIIQIDGDTESVQGRIALRRPRPARLPVAGRADAEDALQDLEPGLLTTDEFADPPHANPGPGNTPRASDARCDRSSGSRYRFGTGPESHRRAHARPAPGPSRRRS